MNCRTIHQYVQLLIIGVVISSPSSATVHAQTLLAYQENPASLIHLISEQPLSAAELNTIAVFEKAAKSVAYITNTAIRRDFWSLNTFEVPQGYSKFLEKHYPFKKRVGT